jgi:Uma2 family endonuclease
MGLKEEVRQYTLAEYLALEEIAEFKSEFHNGQIYAMSGGTPVHSAVIANCIRALGDAFDPMGCQVFDGNLMVHVEFFNSVLYPDASVICSPLELNQDLPLLVDSPSLVLEVLSKGTSKYDRGNKFFKYQMIPTLQTYVLVEQYEPCVHVSSKSADGNWSIRSYVGLDAVVELAPLGVSIRMADIYKWVKF